jgi:fatty-acyl-CoA synthase
MMTQTAMAQWESPEVVAPTFKPEETTGYPVPYLLRRRAEIQPDRTALNVNNERFITYSEWNRRADALARGLAERGVGFGVVVGLVFDGLEWIDYAIAYMGVLKTGAAAVHLNSFFDNEELIRRLDVCGTRLVVLGPTSAPPRGWDGQVVSVESASSQDDSPFDIDIPIDTDSDYLFTSGTTGVPKAIVCQHGNLTYGRGPAGFYLFGDPEPLLAPMRLGTTASKETVNYSVHTPSTLVLCPFDDANRMAELTELLSIPSIMVTPWIAIQLVRERVWERYDLSCVTTMANASSALPPAHARQLTAGLPNARLNVSYSCSEAVPASVGGTWHPDWATATGRPTRGSELRILTEDGREAAVGEMGELWLRNPAPKRRFHDPELNARSVVDRWTRSGDLGWIGEDERLYLFDRKSAAVRTATGLVSTLYVENALYENEDVLEAAALGRSGGDDDEVVAAVVLREGGSVEAVAATVAEHLEPWQRPVQIHAVESLPRGWNGKVIKHRLREALR